MRLTSIANGKTKNVFPRNAWITRNYRIVHHSIPMLKNYASQSVVIAQHSNAIKYKHPYNVQNIIFLGDMHPFCAWGESIN